MKMVPMKLEVEDPLEDKHGPFNKRSKLFMALVQRLTGLSSSSRSSEKNETSQSQPRNNTNSYEMKSIKVDDDESFLSPTDQNCGGHKYSSVLLKVER